MNAPSNQWKIEKLLVRVPAGGEGYQQTRQHSILPLNWRAAYCLLSSLKNQDREIMAMLSSCIWLMDDSSGRVIRPFYQLVTLTKMNFFFRSGIWNAFFFPSTHTLYHGLEFLSRVYEITGMILDENRVTLSDEKNEWPLTWTWESLNLNLGCNLNGP